MTDAPTRLLLIRHGVNDYIKEGRLAGRTPGIHINEQGRAQARAVAQRLAGVAIAAVYSSPLERTLETAEAVAAVHNLPVMPLEGVSETDYGDWTGQRIEDLNKTDLWKVVQISPSGARFPNGESLAETQSRMVAVLEQLRSVHHGQTIVVLSHSDPIKLAVAYYIGLALDLFQRLTIDPTSVTELDFSAFPPRLTRCNDTAHLPPAPKEDESGGEEKVQG